jgi:hypothetical protein
MMQNFGSICQIHGRYPIYRKCSFKMCIRIMAIVIDVAMFMK